MSLVTFGCSFTFGQSLPDNHVYPHEHINFKSKGPSKYAWPARLGTLLNVNVVNNGNPGAGNLEIFQQIVTYPFKPDDICVILWSQFIRHDFFQFSSIKNGERVDQKTFLEKNDITNNKWIVNNRIKNWFTIQHAMLYLESIKIKNYSLLGITDAYCFPVSGLLKLKNMDTEINNTHWIVDKALDEGMPGGDHPGVESHKNLANIFYDKLTNNVLY